jgi:hypothetical protein
MFYRFLNLAFFILIIFSKELFVFNEEILILFSFFVFIYLVSSKASSSIAESLNEQILDIKNKFQTYHSIQEKSILQLVNYNKKQSLLALKIEKLFKLKTLYLQKLVKTHNNRVKKYIVSFIDELLYRFTLNAQNKQVILQKTYIIFVSTFVKLLKKNLLYSQAKKNLLSTTKSKPKK